MKSIVFFVFFSTLLLIPSFTLKRKPTKWFNNKDVPGILFIDANWGIDQTEISNFSWLEFMFWTKRIYSTRSKQYLSILPDTTLWLQLDSVYHSCASNYLRHPAFRNYPVVGISYEQMEAYCKWRSDRVFEYGLYKFGYLTYQTNTDSTKIITIDKYKNGELKNLSLQPTISKFPHYRLPTKQEWNQANEHALKQYKQKPPKKTISTYSYFQGHYLFPVPVKPNKTVTRSEHVFYLQNNVSEQLQEKGLTVGENWRGKTIMDQGSHFSKSTNASVTLGFRCTFEWR